MTPYLPIFLCILSFLYPVFADPVHIPLYRRSTAKRSFSAMVAEVQRVQGKYYGNSFNRRHASKRAGVADVPIIDQEQDVSYIASVEIGTPPQTMHVVLDTGSSDLFVADNGCTNCDSKTPLFQPSQSSSLQTTTGQDSRVQLPYDSGQASGVVAKDTVSMSGFTVQQQVLVTADNVSQDFLQGSVSGILGLAFTSLAVTGATPFWLTLMNSGQTSSPEMSFFLQRLTDDPNAPEEAPGGTFTLGGTNSSFFTGNIEFTNIVNANPPSFWFLPISEITVQGKSIPVGSGFSAVASIDTGTSLIGGPTEAVKAIYDLIPGSQAIPNSESQEIFNSGGMFAFPCTTNVTVTISFGGTAWPINPKDMIYSVLPNSNNCAGAFFDASVGSPGDGNPIWVIGDTFLKNVYTVFRSNPPSVGFAQLSTLAGGTGGSGVVSASSSGGDPTPAGSPTATVTTPASTSSGTTSSNYSAPSIIGGSARLVTLLASIIVAYSIYM